MSTASLIDVQGRLIAHDGDRVYSLVDRGYFCLTQPELDLQKRISRAMSFLESKYASASTEPDQIVQALTHARDTILSDPAVRGLFDGVHVPFVLPQTEQDFAEEFDRSLLPSVERSYRDVFPDREFRNFCSKGLARNCSIVPTSRWGRIPAMRSESYLCGWYFPTALSGYAIPDQRTIISRLPDNLILSGPSEVAAALICAPELLYKTDGKYGKLLALSSVAPVSPAESYFFWFFESYGWDLDFNQRSFLGAVSEYFSGGLTVIASS